MTFTSPRQYFSLLPAVGLALALSSPALAQDGPLAVARDLYASARYDEALAMLNGVRQQESGNPTNLRYVEQYRSLCLLALGRGAEAEAAIAVVVASDPMYQPTETEASPRVRTAFSEVPRKRRILRVCLIQRKNSSICQRRL